MPKTSKLPIDRDEFRRLLDTKQMSQGDMARELGLNPSAMSNIITGKRTLKIIEAAAMARRLEVTRAKIHHVFGIEDNPVVHMMTISGHIRGDEVHKIDKSDREQNLEVIESPYPGYCGVALVVVGHEMAPRYEDGEKVFYQPEAVDFDGCLGHDAIVETEDGRRFLKVLHPGSAPGLYLLLSRSPSVPPIVDARLKGAWRVDLHKP